MHRITMLLYLAALLVSCCINSVLRADELFIGESFFFADESLYQWVNEHHGRVGELLIHGALSSSPCSLETNEIKLPLRRKLPGIITRYELKMIMRGCGNGGRLMPTSDRERISVIMRAVLSELNNDILTPEQHILNNGSKWVFNGTNKIIFLMNESQIQALPQNNNCASEKAHSSRMGRNAFLRLFLNYE